MICYLLHIIREINKMCDKHVNNSETCNVVLSLPLLSIGHRATNMLLGRDPICSNLTSPTFPQHPTQVAPHGRPGLGRLEQCETVTPITHSWRIFAPVFLVFGTARQGRRKSRRFRVAVRPTLPSPAPTCLAAVHAGSQSQRGTAS